MAVFNRAVFNAAVFNAAVAGPPPARDWTIVLDLRDRLEAAGLFDAVVLGSFADNPNVAYPARAVWLSVRDWKERDLFGDTRERTVEILAELRARADDPGVRGDALSRMNSVLHNAADRASLAGVTLPARTYADKGRATKAAHPESATDVTVTAVYLIDRAAGHYQG